MTSEVLLKRIRILLGLFIIGIVLSGVTAFPLDWEVGILFNLVGDKAHGFGALMPGLAEWIARVHEGVHTTGVNYPFMAYGTDWLAFGHLVIAIAFWGPLRDPVRNVWVIDFGMITCALVIPLAMICGPIRGIPFGWRLIDCSFGVFGLAFLVPIRNLILRLEATSATDAAASR